MHAFPITAIAGAILGLLYVVLSVRVIMARGGTKVSLGDGGGRVIPFGEEHAAPLLVATRTHANFAEYVPLCLVLLAFVEVDGTRRWIVELLAAMLVIGRLLHPLGMGRKVPNPFRAAGIGLTLCVLLAASVAILVEAVQSGHNAG